MCFYIADLHSLYVFVCRIFTDWKDPKAEFFVAKNGKMTLTYDGYMYGRAKINVNHTYWRCFKFSSLGYDYFKQCFLVLSVSQFHISF